LAEKFVAGPKKSDPERKKSYHVDSKPVPSSPSLKKRIVPSLASAQLSMFTPPASPPKTDAQKQLLSKKCITAIYFMFI
jgi:hypothetical protein